MKPKSSFQMLSVMRGSLREDEFASYQVDDESKVIREAFRAKRFTAKGIGLDYRVTSHWDEQGILPEGSRETEGQWRKFTLIEVAWIRVAQHLREFGISLPVILEIKKCVLERDEDEQAYPFFEFFFLKAVTNDADHFVVYMPDGHADLVSGRELEILKMTSSPQDMLLISLKSIAKEMGITVADITPAITLSDAEMSLILHARGSNTREINVEMRNGRISEVENTRTYPDDTFLKFLTDEITLTKGYGEVTKKFSEGRGQSRTVKRKEKFK
jgi:DNA-binding transcriptional MerR regulator